VILLSRKDIYLDFNHNFANLKELEMIYNSIVIVIYSILIIESILAVQMSSSIKIPTKIKCILWDVDGTLSDSFQLGFSSTKIVLNNNGIKDITENEYHQGTKYTTPRRLAWHVTGNPDDAVGISLGREFDELYVKLVSTKTAPLYPGMLDLLNKLLEKNKSLKYGALSNACGGYVRAVCSVNDLDSKFLIKYGADDVAAAKPSPSGLLSICRELNLETNECIYIGDSPSDGQAATAADMFSIGVTWGSHPVDTVQPAFSKTVFSISELESLLLSFI